MSDQQSDTLYNSVRNSDKILLSSSEDKYILCCCISEKWCFEHTGVAIIKEYDQEVNNCFTCLDCCTWCLEFHTTKSSICKKQTNCYLCCCSIYFT
jgi:hypothetical protein